MTATRHLIVKLTSPLPECSYFAGFLLEVTPELLGRIRAASEQVVASQFLIASINLRVDGIALAGSEYIHFRGDDLQATEDEIEEASDLLAELTESRWATEAEIALLSKLEARNCEGVVLRVDDYDPVLACYEDNSYAPFESDLLECLRPLLDGTESLAAPAAADA